MYKHGGNTSDKIADDIREELRCIESSNDVVVVYAAESGSRAWGFASQDSDYDVRFIYTRKPTWYLSMMPKSDVIKKSFKDIDLMGWDLQKALRLYRKNNPQLNEWLESHIIYKETHDVVGQLRHWKRSYFSKCTALHHYLGMAQSENEKHLSKGDRILIKKYLYVLRSVFACRFVHILNQHPPMRLDRLLQAVRPSDNYNDFGLARYGSHISDESNDKSITEIVLTLIKRKERGEHEYTDRLPQIDDFINTEIAVYESIADSLEKDEKPIEWDMLDNLFRKTLDEIYYPPKPYDGGEEWNQRITMQ